ncbi:MAG: 3-hydroxyacyl-CoA dehydrogenase family protein [Pseudomonadales bacterium]|nr:3-hydroxyacyl-CoA dehydrogenase family protein [Pseudomonadales bacterium]
MSNNHGRMPLDTESNNQQSSFSEQLPRHIGVIGAGVMGAGVAQTFASYGFTVSLIDSCPKIRDSALKNIRQQLRAFKLTHPDLSRKSVKDTLNNINVCGELSALQGIEYVIENISESIEKKNKLYQALNHYLEANSVIVANTSAIPIHLLGKQLQYPHNLLGIHFMNPVPLKNTVELIIAQQTAERALNITRQMLKAVNKHVIEVADKAGFVSNRILMLTVNEAIQTLADNVSSAENIDAVFKDCFGHPMGPLATADLIGLDVIRDTLLVLQSEYNNQKYCPAPLLDAMVSEGKLGRKSGLGFFSY